MRIVVPYTHPPLLTAATGHDVDLVDVSVGDDAYWSLLANLWGEGEGFAVVEHDVYPSAEALDDLADCPKEWCAAPYPYWRGMQHGLACAKFGPGIMTAVPDLWRIVARMYDATHPPKHWCRLDAWSNRVLTGAGWERHDHDIPVAHTHVTPSHGCI